MQQKISPDSQRQRRALACLNFLPSGTNGFSRIFRLNFWPVVSGGGGGTQKSLNSSCVTASFDIFSHNFCFLELDCFVGLGTNVA